MNTPVPFKEALLFWVKLGFINFGGPAGQIAIMHRELVERRRWVFIEPGGAIDKFALVVAVCSFYTLQRFKLPIHLLDLLAAISGMAWKLLV